jgi:Tfp pilus assembly protein PilO
MNRDRLWSIGAIAGMTVVVLLGWFVGVSPLIAQASAANDQANSLNQVNTASVAKLAMLKQQSNNLSTLQRDLGTLRESIPTGADIPGFLTEINALCAKYNVSLQSVTVNDASIYQAPAAPVVPTTSADGSTATPTPAPSPTTPAGTVAPVAPASNVGALVLVPVVISVTGTFTNVMAFTGGIQTGGRLYLANEVAASPGGSGGSQFVGTLTGFVYSLQGTSGELPAEAKPVPTVEPTPTDTSTPVPTETPIPTGTATPTP